MLVAIVAVLAFWCGVATTILFSVIAINREPGR
jgi:hypothetical protein